MCGVDPHIWTAQCCPSPKHQAVWIPLVTRVSFRSGHCCRWKFAVVGLSRPVELTYVDEQLSFQCDLLFRVPSQEGQRSMHCAARCKHVWNCARVSDGFVYTHKHTHTQTHTHTHTHTNAHMVCHHSNISVPCNHSNTQAPCHNLANNISATTSLEVG